MHNLFLPDVDECATGDNNCHHNATCLNIEGSFKCKCRNGYVGDGVSCCISKCDLELLRDRENTKMSRNTKKTKYTGKTKSTNLELLRDRENTKISRNTKNTKYTRKTKSTKRTKSSSEENKIVISIYNMLNIIAGTKSSSTRSGKSSSTDEVQIGMSMHVCS